MAPHHAHSARRTPFARPALVAAAAAAALLATGCSQATQSGAPASSTDGAGTSTAAASAPAAGDEGAEPPGKEAGDGDHAPGSAPSPSVASPSSAPGALSPPGGEPTKQPPRQAGGFPWCSPDALSVALRGMEAGAGNRYAALVFTNTSHEPCRTRGWPGLQLTSDSGAKIRTDTVRDRSVASRPLTLKPDDRAWSRLHWTVVPGTGDPKDGACPAPGALRVIPPDERATLTAGWKLGTICGSGTIDATALRTGEGPRR